MKKRVKFICFLILTLCVFYGSIPGTVFGQDVSLAQQVFDKYSATLMRRDVQRVLPRFWAALRDLYSRDLLTWKMIASVLEDQDDLHKEHRTINPLDLLGDPEIQAMLRDVQVRTLLEDMAAIDELAGLLNVREIPGIVPSVVLGPVGSRIRSVKYSPDGNMIATGNSDGTVHLWDVATGRLRSILRGHTGDVNSVAFSPDGNAIASASDDSTVRLWDMTTEDSRHTLRGHTGVVNSVAFSPDGNTIASGSYDRHGAFMGCADRCLQKPAHRSLQ